MSEYTPSEGAMLTAWHRHVTEEDSRYGLVRDDAERATKEFVRFLARVRRDAQIEAAQMIRDACDRWEVDGDDERLVNDVLDPWTSRVLTPEEDDR